MSTPVEYICKHKPNSTLHDTPIKHQRNDGRDTRVHYLELEVPTTIDSRGARPRITGMRIPRSRDECSQAPSIGEVRSMRADIVDRGIEDGTAKFIVDGGRCGRVKYDDYDRDEIGSRGFSAAY